MFPPRICHACSGDFVPCCKGTANPFIIAGCFSRLLYSPDPGIPYIARRQFSPERFYMQRYSGRTLVKQRHANGFRIFTAAFRKSKIWVFRSVRPLFTCLIRPFPSVSFA